MELKSNKYKTRLIVIAVIIVLSIILGIIIEKQVLNYSKQVDQVVSAIQAIPEDEYNERVAEKNEEGATGYNKGQALEIMQKIQNQYSAIFEYPEPVVIFIFILAISGPAIGVMMYFIATEKILKKAWTELNKWLSIALRIVILFLLLRFLLYPLVTIGVLGQIPFIIYVIYKYIKLKNVEDKDDIIK